MALSQAGLLGEDIELDMTVPRTVTAGLYHRATDRLALMLDMAWIDMSEFGKFEIAIGQNSTSYKIDYRDVWLAAVGGDYELNEKWKATGGLLYMSSAISDSNRSFALPYDALWAIGGGFHYRWRANWMLHAIFTFVQGGDARVDQQLGLFVNDRVAGKFTTNRSYLLSLGFTWGGVPTDD